MADATNLFQIVVGEDGLAHFQALLLGIASRIEQVRTGPIEGHETHDEFFADRVDRRVGHLREILLEIGVKQLRAVDKAEMGVSVPIEPDSLLAGRGHWGEEDGQILLRIAERLLAIEQ